MATVDPTITGRDSLPITVIEPRSGWQPIDWRELFRYRDLFYFFVLRDVKVLYKQTVLGFGWAIIRPVFSMIVFSIVFGGLAGVSSDGVPYPVFCYVALVPWTYFSSSMTKSTLSLVSNSQMLTKVYFPRLIFPMTPVMSGLVDFGIAMTLVGVLMAWYGIAPSINIVFVPFLILVMMLTAMGIGMWLSALAVKYRDVKHAVTFMAQILMYAAPVVWPVSLVSEKLPQWSDVIRPLYAIYPMAGVIEGFRAALLGTQPMPWDLIGIGTISAVLLVVSGAFYFRRMERFFADVA